MAIDVVMPQMGESIMEGTIVRWLKQPGDRVEKDEPLFEISTDKVDAEIPSTVAGILAEIRFPVGATVTVNTVVAVIADPDSTLAAAKSASSFAEPATKPVSALPVSAPPSFVPHPGDKDKDVAKVGHRPPQATPDCHPEERSDEGSAVAFSPSQVKPHSVNVTKNGRPLSGLTC